MNREVAKIFSKVVLSDRTVHIKLLGDSITQGARGTGFEQNGEHIVEEFYRNPNGYCWANKFKSFMETNFDCTVTNNGCSGTTIEFMLKHFDVLVDDEDDIIICGIGTNNRHQWKEDGPEQSRRERMEKFYDNLVTVYNKLIALNKEVIFFANIPALAPNECQEPSLWRHLHMNDIHDMYVKAACECGFPLIDMYTSFMDYCEIRNIPLETVFYDGLHPNDKGYDIMYDIMMKELGIAKKVPHADW